MLLSSFLQHGGLPFADVLDADRIQQTFEDEQAAFGEGDDAVYTPAITLWAFLSQVLHKDEQRSCAAASDDVAGRVRQAALRGRDRIVLPRAGEAF